MRDSQSSWELTPGRFLGASQTFAAPSIGAMSGNRFLTSRTPPITIATRLAVFGRELRWKLTRETMGHGNVHILDASKIDPDVPFRETRGFGS